MTPIGWIAISMRSWGYRLYSAFAARRHRVSRWLGFGLCGINPQGRMQGYTAEESEAYEEYWQAELNGPQRLWQRVTTTLSETYYLMLLIVFVITVLGSFAHHQERVDHKPQWARHLLAYFQVHQPELFQVDERRSSKGQVVLLAQLNDGREFELSVAPSSQRGLPHKKKYWGFYEERLMFKLLHNTEVFWPLVIDWIKRPIQRFQLSPQDQVQELILLQRRRGVNPQLDHGTETSQTIHSAVIRSWSRGETGMSSPN